MTRIERLGDDRGSAVVDFALTSILLLFVFLAVFQLGLALHVRNTLVSCASEGARYGARAGSSPEQGAARARDLIDRSLSPRYSGGVVARTDTTTEGVQVVVVDVTAPLPVIGPVGPGDALDVRGRAFLEEQ
ncbi:TadE family protein [Janibacter terrae]|uniref:TadE family protein n=1 Tax=Janibacter terrae TaxID=103817 RepID=UPI0009EF1B14|nr:TadE family protein [Janibacter terrae]MBA4086106.1 pilus assembly protein [Kytococcus sp.]